MNIRFAPVFTSTQGLPASMPTSDPEELASHTLRALERFELDRPVRLLGVRAEMGEP
jgi:DNA polymerase IV